MTESTIKRMFVSIYSYCIMLALFGILSSSYHACFNSSLSTLEKRFHFSSSTGGYIMITDNIATLVTNLFVGYYGKTAHKPRWMAIGCLITGFSVMLSASPYFIYGPAKDADLEIAANVTLSKGKGISGDQMCLAQQIKEDCSDVSAATTMTTVAVACFALSNFFRGFGTSIYSILGGAYLDDNVSKSKMPAFFAFVFGTRILGSPIGYYLASTALKFNENPFYVPADITESDPRWIGAWWIGFLVSGTLMILLAIPLAFFPREFKKPQSTNKSVEDVELMGTNGVVSELTTRTQSEDDSKQKQQQDLSIKQLPGEIFAILSNPLILCQMMGDLFRGFGIIGFFVYQARYLETQFRQSASKASLVSGTTGFIAKIFGVLFGGMLITLFQPRPRVLTTFIFLVELSSVFALLGAVTIAGPAYIYPKTMMNEDSQLDLRNTCNKNCFCDNMRYQPVCEQLDAKAYFSPCHAGCKNSFKTIDGGSAFTECECIDSPTKHLEKCPPDTERLMKYATVVAIGSMISGTGRSGNIVTFFRSINPDQKSLAIATKSFLFSLLVSIPYPIVYSKLFDHSCLVWSRECNKRGNCWLYDTEKLRYMYHSISFFFILLGSFFDIIMIFLSPRLGNLYEDDESSPKSRLRDRLLFWKSKSKLKSIETDKVQDNVNTAELEEARPKVQVTKL